MTANIRMSRVEAAARIASLAWILKDIDDVTAFQMAAHTLARRHFQNVRNHVRRKLAERMDPAADPQPAADSAFHTPPSIAELAAEAARFPVVATVPADPPSAEVSP